MPNDKNNSNQTNNKEEPKETRKTIEAKNKFKARDTEIIKFTELIKKIEINYKEIIEKVTENVNIKNRTWFDDTFSRIEFEETWIRFYIEFTIIQSDIGGNNLKGSIIYGVSRPECFSNCFYGIKKKGNVEMHIGGKTANGRCDLLEDKPLIQFLIDKHGLITAEGESEKDGWWINSDSKDYKTGTKDEKKHTKDDIARAEDDKKYLAEFHFLTLNKIWNDALEWVNEKILP